MNVIGNAKAKTGYPAAAYAEAHIAVAGPSTNEEVLSTAKLGSAEMPGFGVRARSLNAEGEAVLMNWVAVGNTLTETLYIISFESPEASWEQAWKLGERMMDTFALDSEI